MALMIAKYGSCQSAPHLREGPNSCPVTAYKASLAPTQQEMLLSFNSTGQLQANDSFVAVQKQRSRQLSVRASRQRGRFQA